MNVNEAVYMWFPKSYSIYDEDINEWVTKPIDMSVFNEERNGLILKFIENLMFSEEEFDFNNYANQFIRLPETQPMSREYSETLSAQAELFFNNLDVLRQSSSIIVFKMTVILFSVREIGIRMGPPSVFWGEMAFLLSACLSDQKTSYEQTLAIGIECWKKLPHGVLDNRANGYDKNSLFINPLSQLFVTIASTDVDQALFYFDLLHDEKYPDGYSPSEFFNFFENPKFFLQFSKLIKYKRPHYYGSALKQFIRRSSDKLQSFGVSEMEIREASNELFSILTNENSPYYRYPDEICRILILDAYTDELWYSQLPSIFWTLAKERNKSTKKSVWDRFPGRKYFLTTINGKIDESLMQDVYHDFCAWAYEYKSFPQDVEIPTAFIQHAKNLIENIECALHEEYPFTRNRKTPPPKHCLLAEEAVKAYWNMARWISNIKPSIYFYILETGLTLHHFSVEMTETLAGQAEKRFIAEFKSFATSNKHEAAILLTYMIQDSNCSDPDEPACRVLDQVYPVFLEIDAEAAKQILIDASQGNFRYRRLWKPERWKLK